MSACATNPVSGIPDFVTITEQQEISIGASYHNQILEESKIIDNKEQYNSSNTPMTIFHLLTHTSGLSYGFLPDTVAGIYRKEKVSLDASISLEEEAKKISSFPLLFDPGSNWYYSVSTDILAT